jgi:hypothetical protein
MAVFGTVSDSNDPVRKTEGLALLKDIFARRSTSPQCHEELFLCCDRHQFAHGLAPISQLVRRSDWA